jgi:hypothetical protein
MQKVLPLPYILTGRLVLKNSGSHQKRRALHSSTKCIQVPDSRSGGHRLVIKGFIIKYANPKIQQTKMLVTCQRFGDLFLFGLVWQYSSNHKTYSKGRFKVIATYLQQ